EVRRAVERLTAGEVPVLVEDALHAGDGGPLQAQELVAPGAEGWVLAEILVADIHAADEADAAVDHGELAVVAQVHLDPRPQWVERQERGHLAACDGERPEQAPAQPP